MASKGADGRVFVKWKGYEIRLTNDLRFEVLEPGADPEDVDEYDSIALAKMGIEKLLKVKAKRKTAAIAVVTDTGRPFIITGINRHTGSITTNPKWTRDNDEDAGVYPDVDAIKPMLARRCRLKRELLALDNKLEEIQIHQYRSYGRGVEEYPEKVDALIKEYEVKKAKAEKLGAPKKARELLAPTAEDNSDKD